MRKLEPIILIESNEEDRLLFTTIFKECGINNRLHCFDTFVEARQYIIAEQLKPFLLFSNALQFNEGSKQNNYKKHKDIYAKLNCPCLFYSIIFAQCFVIDTYSIPTQSYFISPFNEDKFKQVIDSVVQYWSKQKLTKFHKKDITNRYPHL